MTKINWTPATRASQHPSVLGMGWGQCINLPCLLHNLAPIFRLLRLARYSARLQLEPDHGEGQARQHRIWAANPKFVLRPHLQRRATEAALCGDLSELSRVQALASSPFEEHADTKPQYFGPEG